VDGSAAWGDEQHRPGDEDSAKVMEQPQQWCIWQVAAARTGARAATMAGPHRNRRAHSKTYSSKLKAPNQAGERFVQISNRPWVASIRSRSDRQDSPTNAGA